jgi:hypothetical protein
MATGRFKILQTYFQETNPVHGMVWATCACHLMEQQLDNDVLNKEDIEGIVYQVKIG